jgi:DNA-binding winged helix-turn-helix (wHTH) protein/Flp pilus assembly protein TadD
MTSGTVYHFEAFTADASSRRLTRDGEPVPVPERHLDVLLLLLAHAGTVVSKDALVEGAWRSVAVTDNSLEQAISALRRLLGTRADGHPLIETVPRQGYRLTAPVQRTAARATDEALDALLAPHRAWIEGRAALETLARDEVARARGAFERVVAAAPDQASAHVGLANACVMQFEATRADPTADRAALGPAERHAREACRLDPAYGEAWATLGFVLDKTGHREDALAASTRAIALEPDNWRHHLRLASVSWGEARLRAAQRTLALLPGSPLAHWLAATVHVARQALDQAERELRAGIAAQDQLADTSPKFSGVALHWLLGLILLARGADDDALAAFERELSLEAHGHLYARECCANTWYAIGALHARRGRRVEAERAFRETLSRVAAHPLASAALGALHAGGSGAAIFDTALTARALVSAHPADVPVSLARAVGLSLGGRHTDAARIVGEALAAAPPGSAAWLLPVEPLLQVGIDRAAWRPVLARLQSRAA